MFYISIFLYINPLKVEIRIYYMLLIVIRMVIGAFTLLLFVNKNKNLGRFCEILFI